MQYHDRTVDFITHFQGQWGGYGYRYVPGLKDKITTAHITIITVGKKLLITFLTKDQGTDNFRTKTI